MAIHLPACLAVLKKSGCSTYVQGIMYCTNRVHVVVHGWELNELVKYHQRHVLIVCTSAGADGIYSMALGHKIPVERKAANVTCLKR